MILIHNKDYKEIIKETEVKLNEAGFITTAGSIAKLFSDIINRNIADFYEDLSVNHMQAFLTTATGTFLDSIAILLNCKREVNESDETFRKRIANQVLSLSKANETSLRLAILNIKGIKDVVFKKHTFGPGSFTVLPIAVNEEQTLINDIDKVIMNTASFGERINIKFPDKKKIKLNISLTLSLNVNENEVQIIKTSVRKAVIEYINSLKVAQPFIVNELTERIMKTSDFILDYSCNSFKINEKTCLYINQGAVWDEQYKVSEDQESIIIN